MNSFAIRHAQPLAGSWFYSVVILSCGCRKPVANPLVEITKHDPWFCHDHQRDVKILEVRPATLAQQDALCREEKC